MPLRLSEHLEQDRPRERFWAVGPGALTAQELLAILLGTGTRGRDALAVAGEILARGDGSLRRLATRPWAELAQPPGFGPAPPRDGSPGAGVSRPPAPGFHRPRRAHPARACPFLGEWPGALAPSTRRGQRPRNARADGRFRGARKGEET